jgi:hypothetical protein
MKSSCLFILIAAFLVFSQTTISISGKVSSNSGQPIQGAIVRLVAASVADTTNASGDYSLSTIVSSLTPVPRPSARNTLKYENRSLTFRLPAPAMVSANLYDMRGALVRAIYSGYMPSGETVVRLGAARLGGSMYLLRVTLDGNASTIKIIPSSAGTFSLGELSPIHDVVAKASATLEWVQATKAGYASHFEQLAVTSGTVNIILNALGTPPDFGPNVLIFDPSMNTGFMQARLDTVSGLQDGAQFGAGRYAYFFKPGFYNLDVRVGFYTEALGLGLTPDSVQITGLVHSEADWMGGNATCTFWRACAGICVLPDNGLNRWAASQGVPVRRMHIKGNVALDDGGWSSGGYIADTKVDGSVSSGSQQQYFSRNDVYGSWGGQVWNMVFVGVTGAPTENGVNRTVVPKTPLIAEKPFLNIDRSGNYFIMVPDLRRDSTAGVSWAGGTTAGIQLPIDLFYIAKPTDNAASINAALASGKNMLFTPGHYNLESTILVTRPGTVVLGIGYPSLTPVNGNIAMKVSDVDGVKIGGLLLEGNTQNSPVLLQVGDSGSTLDHSKNPICLYDIFCRVGGQFNGLAACFVKINCNDVILDHTWLWRADHGAGAGWNSNKNANGLIVNGNNVTVYGLFVEHTQEYQTWWNGENGRVYFYQSEMPYDPPDQPSWMRGSVNGYPSYKVSDNVRTHEARGLGVYSVFHNNVASENAYEVPMNAPGIKMHHLVTQKLGGGEITHVINTTGGTASSSVLDYP